MFSAHVAYQGACMTKEIDLNWLDGMAFSTELDGHRIVVDADAEVGGLDRGPRPKALLMVSLAGCTAMDVISILRKMREPVSWFNIKVKAELTDEHPKRYTRFRLIYQFRKSDGLKHENVTKAIQLSQEKYCGVAATLKQAAELAWDVEYL